MAASLTLGMAAPALAVSPPFAYTEEEWARLRDNVLEYEEIPNLVDEYNVIVQNNDVTYNGMRSQKTSEDIREKMEESIDSLYEAADQMEDMMSDPMMALLTNSYSQVMYSANTMNSSALQLEQQLDSYVTMDRATVKFQLDNVQAMLTATAQDLMISYEKLLLNQDMVKKSRELLESVLESTKRQKELGMATDNAVLSAQANLHNLDASLLQIEAGLRSVHQNLCLMTGWKYDASPQIQAVPKADENWQSKIDLAADKKKAVENNYTHNYNKKILENTTAASDKVTLERSLKDEEKSIAQKLTALYDAAVQSQQELEEARRSTQTAKENLESAERQKAAGSIGNLQYLQQKNAYDSAVGSEKLAELSLFQAIEVYHRAVNGYMA